MSELDRFEVVLHPSGWRFEAARGDPLLHAARAAGIIMPSACRNGTCRRCLCRLLAGTVGYSIEWPGLSREERADGFILACVAFAESALIIDVAAALTLPDAP